ncbi:hypothetical protein [Micromonospora sp. 067-2]|uniref:hypothetical protein n=1 Tax=Micromonospora sp. 067-2 TaxID=2789270 RepID=UPI00397E0EF8
MDGQGQFATVAVLDGVAASDQRWREAFGIAANALAQASGGHQYAAADLSAAHPWVAYRAEEGHAPQRLFQSLGMDYQPVPDLPVSAPPLSAPPSAPPVSGVPQQVSGPPKSVSGVPELVDHMPQLPWAVHTNPVSGQPVSASPQPVSGMPASPAAVIPPAVYGSPPSSPGADAFVSPVRRIAPSAPPRRRTGLWIGIAALVLVVLAGAGGLVAWAGSGDDEPPDTSASASPGGNAAPMPATPPQSPGTEPPQGGKWPTQWPGFTERDNVRTLTNLEGLGFPVKVPMDWTCTLAGKAEGYTKYNCARTASGESTMGGELIVRNCPQPCDERRQTAMRMAEEAWGTRWIRSGQSATYGEALINADGEQRHGLVVVAYYRGGPDGVTDRQLVLRLTGPMQEANQLRRIATYLRDVLVF